MCPGGISLNMDSLTTPMSSTSSCGWNVFARGWNIFMCNQNIFAFLCCLKLVLVANLCVFLCALYSDFYFKLKPKSLSLQDRLGQPLTGVSLVSLKNDHWAAILLSSLGDMFHQVWHYEAAPPDMLAVPAPSAAASLWVEQAHQQEKVWSSHPECICWLGTSCLQGAGYFSVRPDKDERNECSSQGFQVSSNLSVKNILSFVESLQILVSVCFFFRY